MARVPVQVLEMLFSRRAQLHPLQTYVCSQIVAAVEREAHSLKCRLKRNYTYCLGLLHMLARIAHRHASLAVCAPSHSFMRP